MAGDNVGNEDVNVTIAKLGAAAVLVTAANTNSWPGESGEAVAAAAKYLTVALAIAK